MHGLQINLKETKEMEAGDYKVQQVQGGTVRGRLFQGLSHPDNILAIK